jgi:hypothetical protein
MCFVRVENPLYPTSVPGRVIAWRHDDRRTTKDGLEHHYWLMTIAKSFQVVIDVTCRQPIEVMIVNLEDPYR